LKPIISIAAVIMMFLFSCEETSIIGKNLVNSDSFEFSYLDSVSLDFYTCHIDSFKTSTTSKILLGSYSDADLGLISSDAYFLFAPSQSSLPSGLSESTHVFDSITLILVHDGYHYIETKQKISLNVHQLAQDLELGDNDALYNTSDIENGKQPIFIGSGNFKPDITESSIVEISLDADLGKELFSMMLEQDERVTSDDEFKQYFHGFKISAAEGVSPFYRFYSDSIIMRVYYTDLLSTPISQATFNLKLSDYTAYYSKISGEDISEFSNIEAFDDKVSSKQYKQISLVTGGTGYCTRIEIPYIRTLLLEDLSYIISDSELRLIPLTANDDEANALPKSLTAYIVDNSNTQIEETTISANLVLDKEFGRDTYYSLDVGFLINFLLTPYLNTSNYALLICMNENDLTTTTQTISFGDMKYGSELIIYTLKSK
jgi:hypothetical protein